MQRQVFEKCNVDGFKTVKVESIAVSNHCKSLFVGANDGSLVLYDCRVEQMMGAMSGSSTMTGQNRNFTCSILENLRKSSKERKPTTNLICIESWRMLICIVDGTITSYDSQFLQLLTNIPDTKGCHAYAVNERSYTIVVAIKKKLFVYGWQAPMFVLKKELSITDIPKCLHCVNGSSSVIVGYRRHYECIDLVQGTTSRVIDFDREHRMIILELPSSIARVDSTLLSIGLQGIVLDTVQILEGVTFTNAQASLERMEWSGSPMSSMLCTPFILSCLQDGVEIHDLVTLLPLQKVAIPSQSPHNLVICTDYLASIPPFAPYQVPFICNGDQLMILKMIPLPVQVKALIANGLFEEAINLCSICSNFQQMQDIDIKHLHEICADSLLFKGDFEKAIDNYIQANTDFLSVLRQFPDLVPVPLHALWGITTKVSNEKKSSMQASHRAASAVVKLCEFHRPNLMRRADRANRVRQAGIIGGGVMGGSNVIGTLDEDFMQNPDEEIKRAQLLDTVLLSALVACSPSRRAAVVDFLSGPNRCQIESCSMLLASQGNSYTAALLWLFRSQNQHSRVLQALTEDKCVGAGGWTRDEFYQWTAEYLRMLWYHDEDITLPKQALVALQPLIEFDAEMGLGVLLLKPQNKTSFGGKGVSIPEVLQFLRSISNPRRGVKTSVQFGSSSSIGNVSSKKSTFTATSGLVQPSVVLQPAPHVLNLFTSVINSLPLTNGHALAVAFLECLVQSGDAPTNLHDDYIKLLIEGLPSDEDLPNIDHKQNNLEIKPEVDSEAIIIYKTYRKKLQTILSQFVDYNASRVLKWLPPTFLQETALVLSHLGEHEKVLVIYIHHLNTIAVAESYCEKIYVNLTQNSNQSGSSSSSIEADHSSQFRNPGEIYLMLLRVLLDTEIESTPPRHPPNDSSWSGDGDDHPPSNERHKQHKGKLQQQQQMLQQVIDLAEKYFDRIDPNEVLELLPKVTSVSSVLRYITIVMEYNIAKNRNLQIAHQLLRVREVDIRTMNNNSDNSVNDSIHHVPPSTIIKPVK